MWKNFYQLLIFVVLGSTVLQLSHHIVFLASTTISYGGSTAAAAVGGKQTLRDNPFQKLPCSTEPDENDGLAIFQKLGRCIAIQNVCWHLGTIIVNEERAADLRHTLKHRSGWHPYMYPLKKSRLESIINGYPDHERRIPAIPVRSRTAQAEPTQALQTPEYNACVQPVVVYPYYLFNVGHSFQKAGSWLYAATAAAHNSNLVKHMQIIIPAPEGLQLPPFLLQLLQPLSRWPVKSLMDASGGDPSLLGNGDDLQPSCYKQILVCTGATARNISQYGQFLAKHYSEQNTQTHQQPTPSVWRITFDARGGVGRQIDNLDELLNKCSGTRIGRRRLQCSAVNFTDIIQGTHLMLNTDVVVGLHGAGLVNAFLIPHQASIVEIIPLGLKRFVPYAERNAQNPETLLSWYHLFTCDTSLSIPSNHELEGQQPEWTWPLYRGVEIHWENILTVLKHVELNTDKPGKYIEAYKRNRHSFYLQDGNVRQATEKDLRHSCPTTTDVAVLNGRDGLRVARRRISGIFVTWQIPPFNRGLVLIINSTPHIQTSLLSQSFCLSCPDSKEHHDLILAALAGDAAIATVTLPRGMRWDTALDPFQTKSSIRLRSVLFTIIDEENLERMPVYAVGTGSEAANVALMLPAIMPASLVRGVFTSQPSVPSKWMTRWLDMTEWYPAVAMVLPSTANDANRAELDAETMASVQNHKLLSDSGVPTIRVSPNEAALNLGKVLGWLGDSTVDFVL